MEKEEIKYKKFDLEKALAGEKVITRDGRNVRIICHDLKSDLPLIGLITNRADGKETINSYWEDGNYCRNVESALDLFMAPIKRKIYIHLFKGNQTIDVVSIITNNQSAPGINESFYTYWKTIPDYIEE